MRTFLLFVVALAIGLCLGTVANAQIPNPTSVVWDHADFLTATRYDGGYFALPVKADNTCDLAATPGTAPTQTDNLGKPATTTGISMSANLVARPIGCYVYKVKALDASGLFSDWSLASDPFVRRPSTPGKPAPK